MGGGEKTRRGLKAGASRDYQAGQLSPAQAEACGYISITFRPGSQRGHRRGCLEGAGLGYLTDAALTLVAEPVGSV